MASDVRFSVVQNLLESNGWMLVRIRGSHHVFEKSGATLIVVPVHRGKVKHGYVRRIEKIVAEEVGDGPTD